MLNVPTETIQETWHIDGDGGSEYPYRLVCTPFIGAPIAFPCRSLSEAHAKLQAIADEHDRMGYILALA
jgi:hypothetical protein